MRYATMNNSQGFAKGGPDSGEELIQIDHTCPHHSAAAEAGVDRPDGLAVRATGLFGPAGCARLLLAGLFVLLCCLSFRGPVTAAELDSLLEEGLEAQRVGNCKKAVEIYSEYLRTHKKSVDALNWRGMCYDDLGKLKKALADYNQAIKLSPKFSELYNNRGEIFRKQKQYNRAMADYRRALALEPGFAEPHYNMGLVYEAQGQFVLANKEYLAYLKANPNVTDREQVLLRIQALEKKAKAHKGRLKRVAQQPIPRPVPQKKPVTRPMPQKQPRVQVHRPQQRIPGLPPGAKLPPGMEMPDMKVFGIDMKPFFMWMMEAQQKGTLSAYVGLFNISSYLFFAVTLFFIGKKTGAPLAWLAFVPIASIYVLVKSAGKDWWWILLLLIPFVNIVVWILLSLGIARERGKSAVWGVLLIIPCTMPIAMLYLAFSK